MNIDDVGSCIDFDGKTYQIHSTSKHEIRLANEQGEVKITLSKKKFYEKWVAGKIVKISAKTRSLELRVWETLSEKQRQDARDKEKFMRAYDALRKNPPKELTEEMLVKVSKEEKIKKLGISNFYKWHVAWRRSDKSVASLASHIKKRGNKNQIKEAVKELIADVIDTFMRDKKRPTPTEGYRELVRKIDSVNAQKHESEEALEIPTAQTFYRYVRDSDQYRLVEAREGVISARIKHGIFIPGVITTYPNERWEVDHSSSDVYLVDVRGELIGEPNITAIIDHYTKMVAGYDISLETPNSDSIARAIRMAIAPKNVFLENLITQADTEGIELNFRNDWPMQGCCTELVCDNGMDFHSNALKDGCDSFQIDLMYLPRRSGHLKGMVERWFHGYQTDLGHTLPGTSKSNYTKLGEYKPEQEAKLTWNAFNALFAKYVVDVYHTSDHRSIGMSPLEKWKESEK